MMGDHRLASPDLDRIFRGETVSGLSEWQLLERYLDGRDEIAFEAIVARHGPMVMGVCRRMLADHTDVDDAFQATFLVLVRRARHLGPSDAIGPWLHGVAARVAMRSRSEAARRRRTEPISTDVTATADKRTPEDREIGEVVDQELGRLPIKYRLPIVLCYLEGQTHEEAARQLKWPIGTVKGRLARARDLLRSRLMRRGLTPSVAALTLVLARESSAALSHELLDRTVRSSMKIALGQATAQVVSASITSLVEGVLTSMLLNTFKWAGMAVLVCGLAFTSVGVMARQSSAPKSEETLPAIKTLAVNAESEKTAPISPNNVTGPKAAASNEPPKLADLRQELLKAAKIEWEQAYKDYLGTNTGLDRAYQASKRLMDAEEAVAISPDEKRSAIKGQFERIRVLARTQHSHPTSSEVQLAQLRAYAAEAELWLAQARTIEGGRAKDESAKGTSDDDRARDPQSRRILAKLDEKIAMSFGTETPLEDVLKYIHQATVTADFAGLPIYVDPIGLQEAEKSMNSTVIINLEGVPLRRTLQLVLKQLDLIYFVQDGMIYITSSESEDLQLGPPMSEPSPVMLKIAKAERGEMTEKEMKDLVEFLKTREQVMRLGSQLGGGGSGTTEEPAKRTAATDESKQNKELVELLIKETRELMEMLNAAKTPKKSADGKTGLQ
jgi:RNA polymerase sigma factor (sigma-70 family)